MDKLGLEFRSLIAYLLPGALVLSSADMRFHMFSHILETYKATQGNYPDASTGEPTLRCRPSCKGKGVT